MTAPLLRVDELTVAYGQIEAVRRVSLEVWPGTIVTVIGPNGAGKTTLLSALIGLLPIKEGGVEFAGEAMRRIEVERMVARGMALVPEKRELFTEMNVRDNLLLGAFMRRRLGWRDEEETLAQVYARFPRLKERALQPAGTLSGGERQMLAIGRALMARPRLLLLDEPSLGLAPLIVREIFHILADLAASGVAILLVEQNARAALQLADFGYVLETGEVVLKGAADALAEDERVIQSYLGAAT